MAQEQLFADEYKVNLDVFEGPLDLLLYLIRREELDIYDIPIEHITAEYMKFIEEARRLDLDIAGEFIVMAATLMVIKSRMLLPVSRRIAEDGDEEWVDPRLDLLNRRLCDPFRHYRIIISHYRRLPILEFHDFSPRRP